MSDNKQKQEDWLILCEYVKKDIMGYTDDMKFPRFIALRLRGLASGQFMANKKQKPQAEYDYKTILYTFKACKLDIMNGFKSNQTKWKNENHRFNYCMVIIESNINDMVIRLRNAKKAKKQAEGLNLINQENEGATYKKRTKEVENKKLEDLW